MSEIQSPQPGPWLDTSGQIHDVHGSLIAVVMAHDTPVGAANARLVKAAPALLAALLAIKAAGPGGSNNFVGWHQAYEPAVAKARAAIAEATGECA